MTAAWISVVGIGEDGYDGLSPRARDAVDGAEIIIGGDRHLELVPPSDAQEHLPWGGAINDMIDRMDEKMRDRRLCVLASGDPLMYGIGKRLVARFGIGELNIFPSVSAFSNAAARMGWSLPDTQCVTIHGRPVERLHPYVVPGARLLLLSRDGDSPAEVAALLNARGYGGSSITVFEHMGGAKETRHDGTAVDWSSDSLANLNTIAIECRSGPDGVTWTRTPGLPEDAFEHDGKITKREVRAATLAALAPLPNHLLWDIGAGSGAVAIEWLRAEPTARAVALEHDPVNAERVRRNAKNLGTPSLNVIEAKAPAALGDLDGPPDAVFVGGGVSSPEILTGCWTALRQGGVLVANAVTVEAQHALMTFGAEHDADFTKISVGRSKSVGRFTGMKPFMDVLQLRAEKP